MMALVLVPWKLRVYLVVRDVSEPVRPHKVLFATAALHTGSLLGGAVGNCPIKEMVKDTGFETGTSFAQ